MRFSDGLREEILRRTDLVRLVGKRVKLDRKGRVHWGLCPFHKEKSPSFKVENERRHYHCFGCGEGGDAFTWLIEMEGLSFPEAVQKLAAEAGVELPAWNPEDEARETRRKSLYEIISLACEFYEAQLAGRAGETARRYLQSRGLEPAAQKRHRLGYAPSHSALKEHLAAKGIALEDLAEAGLVRPAEEGKPARDFFYDRVMFPIADVRGRIVAFGGRGLSPDAKPKYINTAETPLFSKGHLLYRFGPAREAAARGAALIVAEGYMDVIALADAGFEGALAPLGTALTEDQLQMLWRVVPEPVMCFDGDEAGKRAAKRASRLALPYLVPGQSLRFVFLPKGEDPDSFIRSQGAPAMRMALQKAEPLGEVLWKMETEGRDFSTPERRAGLEAELDALVKTIRDGKIADYYRRDFADRVFKAFKQRKIFQPGSSKGFDRRFPRGEAGPKWSEKSLLARPVGAPVAKGTGLGTNPVGGYRAKDEFEIIARLTTDVWLVGPFLERIASLEIRDPEFKSLINFFLNLPQDMDLADRELVLNKARKEGLAGILDRISKLANPRLFQLENASRQQVEEAFIASLNRHRQNLEEPAKPLTSYIELHRDSGGRE